MTRSDAGPATSHARHDSRSRQRCALRDDTDAGALWDDRVGFALRDDTVGFALWDHTHWKVLTHLAKP